MMMNFNSDDDEWPMTTCEILYSIFYTSSTSYSSRKKIELKSLLLAPSMPVPPATLASRAGRDGNARPISAWEAQKLTRLGAQKVD